MNKRMIPLALSLLVLCAGTIFLLFNHQQKLDTSDWTAWRMSKGQLAFQIPTDWAVEQKDGGNTSVIIVTDNDGRKKLEITYNDTALVKFDPEFNNTRDELVRAIINSLVMSPNSTMLESARIIP